MKYFLLKRKSDGKFVGNDGNFIVIGANNYIRLGMFYPENEALAWGKIWSSIFEFVPVVQQNGYWKFA